MTFHRLFRLPLAARVCLAIGLLSGLTPQLGYSQEAEEEPLASDRPDFTETSSTVGLGRVQIEGGYTYTRDSEDGVTTDTHDLPELLVRVGVTDELELRFGWEGWVSESVRAGGFSEVSEGFSDLELGLKYELWEQCECGLRPETAIILSTTAPSGEEEAGGSEEFQPTASLLYSWELSEDLSFGGSTLISVLNEEGDGLVEFAQSLTMGVGLTDRLGAYLEWYTFQRHDAEDDRPEHYMDSGITFSVNPNFQLDWRAGWGLNDRSDDFFTGAGFAVRY